jgi:hypothetical protein
MSHVKVSASVAQAASFVQSLTMKRQWILGEIFALLLLVTGCKTTPPPDGVERGPHGTIAYDILVESSPPGARIEAEGRYIGEAPLHLKIFGDKDGTFHDFGSDFYAVRALPVTTNQYPQVAMFGTGRWFGPEDRIPERIYFDMNQKPPQYVPGPPVYAYPPAYYYPPPYYYGPSFRFHFGGPRYHHHRYHR